ncbi:hypothetical protein [Rathayibacter sp. VKM Ac-2857]|uniref:hypothetical protein n=1 Tax=Rathayibacter sp. VKM Ac-2857 TaxID=2739020 RepID=UPI0015651B72|nr:hypothetical protein [Rathayibacter sp. VKM Ac-2857]NQX17082.1 hypothetical protein [Rathayibacter sp. VKM Ac-2857]
MPIDSENDSATTRGFSRRAGLTAAWSAPVVAAALSAPGASASTVTPSGAPWLGVFLGPDRAVPAAFTLVVRLGGPAAEFGTPLTLPVDSRVDIVSEHDVAAWGDGIVPDGPRNAHVPIAAGVYRTNVATNLLDGSTFVVGDLIRQPATPSVFTPLPSGTFTVTATVTQGPVYPGAEEAVFGALGRTSSSAPITV